MRTPIALTLSLFATLANAADYTVTAGTPLHESVKYQFDDTVTFTPLESGTYSIDVVPATVFGGCSTRYCHSKWSIATTLTAAYVGDVNLLPLGNASIPMQAGVAYVLHLAGVLKGKDGAPSNQVRNYRDVPAQVAAAFDTAPSPGKHWAFNVHGKYDVDVVAA